MPGPGDLDSSFGEGGRVVTAFGLSTAGQALAIQPDGKIVLAGRFGQFRNYGFNCAACGFAVSRFRSDGSLDASFGQDGLVRTDITPELDAADQLLIQPDGKILVGGYGGKERGVSEPVSDFALVRYMPNGTLDEGFGTAGMVTTDFGFRDGIQAMALQPDGKIIAAGYSIDDIGDGPFSLALARYNMDGDLDLTFGSGGRIVADGGQILALSVLPDGRIRAAGVSGGSFLLASYNQSGSLDTSFGDNGIVTTEAVTFAFGGDMVFAPDGSVFASGSMRYSNPRCSSNAFAVAHFTQDGALDASFGNDGEVRTILTCTSYARAVAPQPDGKVVVAGVAYLGFTTSVFALARYNQDGSRDQSFGRHGKVTTRFDGTQAKAAAVAIDSSGRAVVGGTAGNSFALARYTG